jgi:photosystem II stability/assembly factor-like uncharacterized protein
MVASATAAAEQSQVKYKGIWEPVSYQEDLKLLDVFFATADEGWVAGGRGENSGGVILHTSDGGTHWENQYGDPASSDGGVRGIRFLDPTHGWAVQWTGHAASLLHTRDGKNWILSGTIPEHAKDYMFSSETNGVVIDGGRLLQTTDGGRRWIPVNQCEVSVQVDGLARRVNCTWVRVQFLTPTVGYAAGFSVVGVSGAPVLRIVVLGKSTDGGATWALTTGEVTGDTQDAFFIDENTGYVRAGDQLFKTTDGGQTWTGMAASPGDRLQFADPEVGWSHHYNQVSFTTDGGNRWNSREYPFPAHVETFSLPRRDRGYIVGDHGMIYRYRIVPQDYAAKGMLPAPLLSGIDSPLDVYVQQLVAQVNKISADVGLPPVNTAAPGTVPTQSAVAGGGFTQNTDPNGAATAPDAAAGGFTQNTDPNGSAATAGAGGFSQDVRQAQTTLYSVSTETPKFTSKYRNLNLLLAGLQMASQMTAQVQALQQSLQSLKYAKDPRSAAPSITKVQTSVASLLQLVQNAYQKPR